MARATSGKLRKQNVRNNSKPWAREGENTNWWGRRAMKRGKKRKSTLWGMSGCYEHRDIAWKHRHCCILHQPVFHHRDFHLNCNLICNTIILAYIPGYITLRAKSWPQSAKQLLLLWSKLLISTEVWSMGCQQCKRKKSDMAMLTACVGRVGCVSFSNNYLIIIVILFLRWLYEVL